MLRQYDLLENVLIDIEKGVKEGINLNTLAEKYALSERHLRRLFKFAFKQTLAGYIRSRKLVISLDDLLKTNSTLFDIALEYGFEYEQSYRRAFKHEFGITPGEYRKARNIVEKMSEKVRFLT
jgi:AraC family transcriptional regulator